jgi:hypothetical protein
MAEIIICDQTVEDKVLILFKNSFRTFKKKPLHHYKEKKEKKAVPLHAIVAHGGRGGIAPTHI